MVTKFNLLQKIHNESKTETTFSNNVLGQLKHMKVLTEDVTHVLAAIATAANSNKPLQMASAESLAAFLAGVEMLSQKLPSSKNEQTKQSVLRLMANIRINPDQSLSTNVQPIVDLGASNPSIMKRYVNILKMYEYHPDQDSAEAVSRAARLLQGEIDRALRMVMSQQRK